MNNDIQNIHDKIQFFNEDIEFTLQNEEKIKFWITDVIKKEGSDLGFINFIFCSDKHLHQINIQFLNHDTFTDIITFPYSEEIVEADIFISTERVEENSSLFNVTFEHELMRVIIHGVLHLIGYNDKTENQKSQMRSKEDLYTLHFFRT